ncbi:MAG: membrane-associated protease 1 [Cellulosilyticaceae bacterium]
MGFRLKVEGADTIELGVENILTVEFNTDTPNDSNARSTDLGVSAIIRGKILAAVDGETADSTIKLAQWSLVPAEKADCYRKSTLEIIAASQVVRQIHFPNAFVVDYTEDYGDEEGVGTFYLHIKQKKDKTANVKVEGGFGE